MYDPRFIGPDRTRQALVIAAVALGITALIAAILVFFWPSLEPDERSAVLPYNDPTNAELVADFKAFLFVNEIKHFSARELMTPGGSHQSSRSPGFGLNTAPPRALWRDMLKSLKVLEQLRTEYGKELSIISGYRAPAYNKAVGGVRRSRHINFTAFDVAPKTGGAAEVNRLYALAKKLRDKDKVFVGGIGKYKSWVHIDTREKNADW